MCIGTPQKWLPKGVCIQSARKIHESKLLWSKISMHTFLHAKTKQHSPLPPDEHANHKTISLTAHSKNWWRGISKLLDLLVRFGPTQNSSVVFLVWKNQQACLAYNLQSTCKNGMHKNPSKIGIHANGKTPRPRLHQHEYSSRTLHWECCMYNDRE